MVQNICLIGRPGWVTFISDTSQVILKAGDIEDKNVLTGTTPWNCVDVCGFWMENGNFYHNKHKISLVSFAQFTIFTIQCIKYLQHIEIGINVRLIGVAEKYGLCG